MTAWTAERRQKHAEAIRRWKPWEKSTGPRTAAGKARAAQNAYKHGRRALSHKLMNQSLAAQRDFLHLVGFYTRLRKWNPANELLPFLHARLRTLDHIFHVRLAQALHYERLCKKLAFSPPSGQIVNANDNG